MTSRECLSRVHLGMERWCPFQAGQLQGRPESAGVEVPLDSEHDPGEQPLSRVQLSDLWVFMAQDRQWPHSCGCPDLWFWASPLHSLAQHRAFCHLTDGECHGWRRLPIGWSQGVGKVRSALALYTGWTGSVTGAQSFSAANGPSFSPVLKPIFLFCPEML